MIKVAIKILSLLGAFLFFGCHPKGAEFTEEMDVVVTKHNQKYDFNLKNTYAMPDKIVKITGKLQDGDVPEFIPNEYATKILAQIASNMSSLGYQRVAVDANPDLILAPASMENTTVYYEYWFFWMGGSFPYLGYPVEEEYSYTTGTLLMALFDPDEVDGTGNVIIQWTGAINGLLTGTYSDTRVNKSIDQAYIQSPYLTTN